MHHALEKAKKPAARAEALIGLAIRYAQISMDSSLLFAKRAVASANEQEDAGLLAKAHNVLGVTYYARAQYDLALQHYYQAMVLFELTGDRLGVCKANLNLACILLDHDDYDNAAQHFQKALFPSASSKPEYQLNIKAYTGIMGALAGLKQFSNALEYLAPAQQYAGMAKDSNLLAPLYKVLGALYAEMGKPDSALYYYEKAYRRFVNQGNLRFQAEVIGLSVDCLLEQKQLTLAQKHLDLLDGLRKSIETPSLNLGYFSRLAAIAQYMGHHTDALRHANEALIWADSTRSGYYKTIILKTRAAALESLGQSVKAIADLNTVLTLKDSALSQTKVARVRRILLQRQLVENKTKFDQDRYDRYILLLGWALTVVIAGAALSFAFLRIRSYQQVTRQKNELERLHQVKDQLFAIISHDLRSPLQKALIILNSRLTAENTALLRDKLSRTALMTDSMLIWAKQQMGRTQSMHFSSIVPARIAEDVLAGFQNEIIDKQLLVTNKIAPDLVMVGCPDLLVISLRNIVSNAIRHSPPGKEIMLRSANGGGELRLSVRDEGPGFEATAGGVEQMRDPFSANPYPSQAGIGLFLCQELLRDAGAHIEVASEPGRGSTITICCPFQKEI